MMTTKPKIGDKLRHIIFGMGVVTHVHSSDSVTMDINGGKFVLRLEMLERVEDGL